jgi:hypothetical protein
MKVRESEMPTDSERGHVHLPARESSDEAYHKMEVTTGKTDYVDLRNMSPLSQKLLAVLLVTGASTSQPRGSHPFPFYALSRGHRLSILQTAQKKKTHTTETNPTPRYLLSVACISAKQVSNRT